VKTPRIVCSKDSMVRARIADRVDPFHGFLGQSSELEERP
jgi:hypothetical protein